MLDAVAEQHEPDAVVVANRRHRQHGGQLRRHFTLEAPPRPEAFRSRHVDSEHHRELAFFDIPLDVRALHTHCRHIPVDAPHLVARLILADLGELHALPLEHGAVLAGEQRVHQPACPESSSSLTCRSTSGGTDGRRSCPRARDDLSFSALAHTRLIARGVSPCCNRRRLLGLFRRRKNCQAMVL